LHEVTFRSPEGAQAKTSWAALRWQMILLALTACTLLIHGFHPMAEDGGVYVAGLEYILDPTLFPHYTDFVREHLRFSVFSPLLAAFIHITHLSARTTLLLADLLTIWGTLAASREILRRCVQSDAAQLAGVSLLAAWWTLPVAGTSLLLMDPYVTARSFSMPLSLLSVAFALDDWRVTTSSRRWALLCVLCIFLAALFHPLMAGYGAAMVLLIRLSRSNHRWLLWSGAAAGAVILCAVLQVRAPSESSAVVEASLSRYYWFLSQWRWYELAGLAGPLLVLWALLCRCAADTRRPAETLLRAAIVFGCIAVLVSVLFAREDARTHVVARMQPLRAFVYLYAVMALLLGVALWQFVRGIRSRARTASARTALAVPLFLAAMAIAMFGVQRSSFPASPHIELPGRTSANGNPWVQAFLWARSNTPRDALFALDAKYVNADGEDAQTFRAIALRSALPDYSKDGGEASITPALAPAWEQAARAQQNLSQLPDSVRDARLMPLGATWMVLGASAQTLHDCPYANGTVKICRLSR
jgi:hypothetical protein